MKKDILFFVLFCLTFFCLIGCQTGYLWHVSVHQIDLLTKRVSIEKALKKYSLSEEETEKLRLISEVKTFAKDTLQLDIDTGIYSSYVHLDRPYVTYLLRVSSAYELKPYEWSFPIVGSAPYKGFFDKQKAQKAAESFSRTEYDVYVRGVSAYSTLGWFNDPIFSSMLSYKERDLVTMVFHELIHTILFFKNHINFNERFAEFLGRKAAISFYLQKEGKDSKTVKTMQREWEDELLFSSFMMGEYEDLEKWYKDNKGEVTTESKQKRLKEIQVRFVTEIKPNLKTSYYNYFSNIELNNARLLSYRSYNYDMEEFERLFISPVINEDIKAFIEYCMQFKKATDPEAALSQAVSAL